MRLSLPRWPSSSTNFNPRIPYGMRLDNLPQIIDSGLFQSTHPVWDATKEESCKRSWKVISIHASRMGCDSSGSRRTNHPPYFNPRIPYGMRPAHLAAPDSFRIDFNPRIPYGMRPESPFLARMIPSFQSTHPVWDATKLIPADVLEAIFQSTHPVWDATVVSTRATW